MRLLRRPEVVRVVVRVGGGWRGSGDEGRRQPWWFRDDDVGEGVEGGVMMVVAAEMVWRRVWWSAVAMGWLGWCEGGVEVAAMVMLVAYGGEEGDEVAAGEVVMEIWCRGVVAATGGIIMAKGEIEDLTIEQYLTLTQGNQAPGVVKPELGGNVNFEIKSQFMRELREDTFSRNKNDDAHEHVERVLDIISLFNIPRVTHDAVMLRVFPITLTRAAKRWVDRLSSRTVDSWDILKKAFIQSLSTMNRQLLDSQGPIPGMTPAQALTVIQTMADHSYKWHDGSSRRSINNNNSNTKGIATIVSKLDSLGRDIKKLKEYIHAIQVGCQICRGCHLDKECPQNEEVKSVEEVKKLQENAEINTQNQSASLKNLETQIEQLIKEFHAKTVSEVKNSSFDQCKAVYDDKEALFNNEINESHEVSLDQTHMVQEEDLGASINVIPKSMFEYLKLARLKKTDMLVEMADMTKRAPIGIVKNVLIKIEKFLFPSDFVVIDILKTRNKTVILERPFLETIHAKIDVFNKEISLGIGDDRITFDMNRKDNNFTTLVGRIYMINDEPSSSNDTPTDESSRVEKSDDLIQKHDSKKTRILKPITHIPSAYFCKPIKKICNWILRFWPTFNPTIKACNRGVKIYGMNEEVVLKLWYCYLDRDRKSIKGSDLTFPEFLLVRYSETQGNNLIWDKRYVEWCNENSSPDTPTSSFISIQEDYKLRPKDYPFKDWLLTRVGHTDVRIFQISHEEGQNGTNTNTRWKEYKKSKPKATINRLDQMLGGQSRIEGPRFKVGERLR
ncbi:reverse transcriptase domain-containing protein, partial [Tanacetum coccineum]